MATTVGSLSVLLALIPKDWDKGLNLVNRLKTAAVGLIGVSAMKAVVGFAEKTTAAATEVQKFAAMLGMSVEQTQEWGFVAEQSHSNLKQLSIGLSMFEANARRIADGSASKQLRHDWAGLGLSARDAAKAVSGPKGLQETLLKVSDTAKKMGATGKRGALFRANFGARAGGAFLSDVGQGSAGLKEMFEQRRKMGELNQTQVSNLKILGNQMKNVSGTFSMLGQQILANLAPAFIKLATKAQDWIAANRAVISGAFEAAFKGVAFALHLIGDAIDLAISVARPFVELIRAAANGSDAAQIALIGIATVLTAVLLPAFIAWFITTVTDLAIVAAGWLAVAYAAGLAMLPLLPWVLLLGAVAVGVLLIVKHWETFKAKVLPILKIIGEAILAPFLAVPYAIYQIIDHWHEFVQGAKNGLKSVGEYLAGLPVIKQIIEAVNWARNAVSPDKKDASGNYMVDSDDSSIKAHLERYLNKENTANVAASEAANRLPGLGGAQKNFTVTNNVNINGVQGAAQVPGVMGQVADDLARRQAAADLRTE